VSELAPRPRVALGAASLAVVAWSFGPIIVRAVDASTPTIVFWRLWLAQPVMIGVAYLTRGRLSWPLLRRCAIPGALFGSSIMSSFASFEHTSIANATLIGALQPAVVMLVAPRLFGDRSSPRQVALAAVAIAGMATVVLGAASASGASLGGDLLALVNLAIWIVYFIRVKRVRDEGVHAPSFIAGVFLVAAVTVTPWALFASGRDLGAIGARDVGFVLLMVLGPGLVGHGTMTWAQRHLDITVASLLTLLQPPISTVAAWIVYGERLGAVQLAGAAVVLVAVAGIVRSAHQPAPEARPALPVPVE